MVTIRKIQPASSIFTEQSRPAKDVITEPITSRQGLFDFCGGGQSATVFQAQGALKSKNDPDIPSPNYSIRFINYLVKLSGSTRNYPDIYNSTLNSAFAYSLSKKKYVEELTISLNSAFINNDILIGENKVARLEALISLVSKLSYLHEKRYLSAKNTLDLKLHKKYKSIEKGLEDIFNARFDRFGIKFASISPYRKRRLFTLKEPSKTILNIARTKLIELSEDLDRGSEIKDKLDSKVCMIDLAKELLEQKTKIAPLIQEFLTEHSKETDSKVPF